MQALEVLRDRETRVLLFGGAAGGAKSFTGCYWILQLAFKYAGARLLIGRSELKTLKKTTLVSLFKVAKLMGLKAGKDGDYKYNQQTSEITCSNGSVILLQDLKLYPSDPLFDDLGSLELTAAFVDEANQVSVKAKNIILSRIRHRVDEFGLIPKLLLTCNPGKNWVYSEFYKPSTEGRLPVHLKFIQSFVTDNFKIDPHYVSNLLLLPEVDQQRLLKGNWDYDDDPARLIDYNKIVDLFTNSFVLDKTAEKFMTADIALYGSDKFVIFVWQGWTVIKIYEIAKCEADEVEEKIKEVAHAYGVPRSNIVYDSDGLGSFLRGYLKDAVPFVNNGKPVKVGDDEDVKEEYNNLKSQCIFYAANKIQRNEAYIQECSPEQQETISQELSFFKRTNVDSDKKLSTLTKDKIKEDLKRSPDHSDNIMMRSIFDISRIRIKDFVGQDSRDKPPGDVDQYHDQWYGDDAGY